MIKSKKYPDMSPSSNYEPTHKRRRMNSLVLEENSNICIKGLTIQLREYFYTKLHRALFKKLEMCNNRDNSSFLENNVNLNVNDIARKIECNIFRSVNASSEYKCSIIQKIVELEKSTDEMFHQNDLLNTINSPTLTDCFDSTVETEDIEDCKLTLGNYNNKQTEIKKVKPLLFENVFEHRTARKPLPFDVQVVEIFDKFSDCFKAC